MKIVPAALVAIVAFSSSSSLFTLAAGQGHGQGGVNVNGGGQNVQNESSDSGDEDEAAADALLPSGRGNVKPKKAQGGGQGQGQGQSQGRRVKGQLDLSDLLSDGTDIDDVGIIDMQLVENGKAFKFRKESRAFHPGNGNGLSAGGQGKNSKAWNGRSDDGSATLNLNRRPGPPGRPDVISATVIDEVGKKLFVVGADADGNEMVEEWDAADITDEEEGPDEADEWGPGSIVSRLNNPSSPSARRRMAIAAASAALGQQDFAASSLRGKEVPDEGDRGHRRRAATIVHDNSGTTIDLMVVWTDQSECAMSYLNIGCSHTAQTESNMRSKIDLGVAETNAAFGLSGIDLTVRLVHAYREAGYEESDCSDALSDVRAGVIGSVHAKRDTYGADLVSLLVNPENDGCGGVAYRSTPYASKSSAFSVVRYDRVTGTFTFPHELGHNMGMNHDKGTKGACSTSNINYGFRDPEARFRSILSYDCTSSNMCSSSDVDNDCIRVQRFSNTHSLYPYGGGSGVPIGTQEINNADHLTAYKAGIAAHYDTVVCNQVPDCDDHNSCTTDTCNGSGHCVHTDISGCCGNGVCESSSSEDYQTCEVDCMAELETTFTGKSTDYAHMFDLSATTDLTVRGFEVHVDTRSSFDVEVWTRAGSFVGHESSESDWTKIMGPASVTGLGTRWGTPLPDLASPIEMLDGDTRAFYFYTPDKVFWSAYGLAGEEGTVVKSNDHLAVHQGQDQAAFFDESSSTSSNQDKVWNGVIKYTTAADGVLASSTTTTTGSPGTTTTTTTTASQQKELTFTDNNLGYQQYGECEGDCDEDDDCIGELVCFQRFTAEGGIAVPGCSGTYQSSPTTDFCFKPTQPLLNYVSSNGYQAAHCDGDCDGNSECPTGMLCKQRDDEERVPGCDGTGVRGKDYCYDPNYTPPPFESPTTMAPTTSEPTTKSPTSQPSGVPIVDPGCYSNNYKDCLHESIVDAQMCHKTWLPDGAITGCVALWGSCAGQSDGCCGDTVCHGAGEENATCGPPLV